MAGVLSAEQMQLGKRVGLFCFDLSMSGILWMSETRYAAFIAGLTLAVISLLFAVLLACGMVNEL